MPEPTGRILGVEHLGVAVKSADAASKTFAATFGLPYPGARERLPEHGVSTAFHPLAGDTDVEFIEPLDAENSIARFLDKRGPGVHHIALRVEGIDALLADLKSRGADLIDETARTGAHGTRVAFLHPRAAGGILIEFVEHPSE